MDGRLLSANRSNVQMAFFDLLEIMLQQLLQSLPLTIYIKFITYQKLYFLQQHFVPHPYAVQWMSAATACPSNSLGEVLFLQLKELLDYLPHK